MPKLRITTSSFNSAAHMEEPIKLSDADVSAKKSKLSNDGYFRLDTSDLKWQPRILEKIVRAIENLKSKGWPPALCLSF